MKNLVIVDTSVFIDFLRGGEDDSLSVLILNNQVLLSPIVKLELKAGVRKKELPQLEKLLDVLIPIDSFAPVKTCEKVLMRSKGSGLLAGIPDLLILSDVISHKAVLFSLDKRLNQLAKKLKLDVVSI